MVDQITTLLELAMNSSSDAEKLAALARAKRIYTNQGIQLHTRMLHETTTAPKPTAEVESCATATVLAEANKRYNKLLKDYNRITAENTKLTTELLQAKTTADDEVIITSKLKVVDARTTIAFAVVIIIFTLMVVL